MRIDETRQSIIRESMSEPMWTGVERGVYEVRLRCSQEVSVVVNLDEAVLLRQVGRLLQRIVDENRSAIEVASSSHEVGAHLDAAWRALEPVRACSYVDGSYQVQLTAPHVISYYLTEWDADLLRRYEALLVKLYEADRCGVEEMVAASRGDVEILPRAA